MRLSIGGVRLAHQSTPGHVDLCAFLVEARQPILLSPVAILLLSMGAALSVVSGMPYVSGKARWHISGLFLPLMLR